MLKKLLLALVVLTFSGSIALAHESDDDHPEVGQPILFVREGCSHCANVDAFVEKNGLEDQIERLETFNNDENQAELDEWFDHFKIAQGQRGVPFMVVNEGTYYAGDTPIIEYLADINDIEVTEEDYQTSSSDTLFLVIGGLLMLGVLGYGVYSAMSKKK